MEKQHQQQVQTSLEITSRTGKFLATNEQAFYDGSNIKKCLRIAPAKTREAVIAFVQITSNYIDATKRLSSTADYVMLAEMIFHDFPTLTLEELRLIMDRMMTGYYGEYYNRLKAPEFRKCLQKHELERAPIIENRHQQVYRGADDPTNIPVYDEAAAKLAWRLKNNPFLVPGKNDKDAAES
jgi:hypothetical protein